MSEESTTSSPSLSDSTPPSSPDIQTLQLSKLVVSEKDKIEATLLKVHADKAFLCEIPRHQNLLIQD